MDGNLRPNIPLSGIYSEYTEVTNIDAVIQEIKAVISEEKARLAKIKGS